MNRQEGVGKEATWFDERGRSRSRSAGVSQMVEALERVIGLSVYADIWVDDRLRGAGNR